MQDLRAFALFEALRGNPAFSRPTVEQIAPVIEVETQIFVRALLKMGSSLHPILSRRMPGCPSGIVRQENPQDRVMHGNSLTQRDATAPVQSLMNTTSSASVKAPSGATLFSGGLNRKKTVADLPDKVREALLKTGETGVSLAALSAFLRESGIPVSEATLRQYLRRQGGSKRTRRKSTTVPEAASKPSTEVKPQPDPKPEPKPAQSWVEERHAEDAPAVPDVFGRRLRGPRIADPKNL